MQRTLKSVARMTRRAFSHMALPIVERRAAAHRFSGELIAAIAEGRRRRISAPVIDEWRFPDFRPARYDPLVAWRMIRFISSHEADLNRVAGWYENDDSRMLLKSLFAYRALGPSHVQLPKSRSLLDGYRKARQMKVGEGADLFPPFELALYDVAFNGSNIELECWLGNVVCSFLDGQYYFQAPQIEIAPRLGDIVVDAGACFGDSALAFATSVGAAGAVHSFEPIPRQIEVFRRNIRRNSTLSDRVQLHCYALSDIAGRKLRFSNGGAGAQANSAGAVEVETTSIDTLIDQGVIPRVDFIKMDIEGAELAAIKGASVSIQKFKPRLAISLYHRLSDFIDIPSEIKRLHPEYRFYLGHHSVHQEETILYASAEK
ncbi:MAG TPA: FkbM family methyltransferase [Methylosinus sp.]|jgi:FkbM family methyltransferase|uniref:FkbM family methyltransferase n=1 Tax=Methylosinus sp. TaxID=427 RepID=UPI002F93E7DF